MKNILFGLLLSAAATQVQGQTLQLHYDLRHTISPTVNPANFPTVYFEYWKARDTGQSHTLIKPDNFLLKTEADLLGSGNNIGKFFLQIGQSFRAWRPKIYLQFQYSGGAGVTEPKEYSYYITNTYCTGVELPFHWKGTWFTSVLDYRYVAYTRPTQDPIYTLYWWKGLLHYKLELVGDFSCWTENKNHGDEVTAGQQGKRFFFFAEPQVWYNLNRTFAVGSKLNTYYNVNINNNVWQVYPTAAVRAKL